MQPFKYRKKTHLTPPKTKGVAKVGGAPLRRSPRAPAPSVLGKRTATSASTVPPEPDASSSGKRQRTPAAAQPKRAVAAAKPAAKPAAAAARKTKKERRSPAPAARPAANAGPPLALSASAAAKVKDLESLLRISVKQVFSSGTGGKTSLRARLLDSVSAAVPRFQAVVAGAEQEMEAKGDSLAAVINDRNRFRQRELALLKTQLTTEVNAWDHLQSELYRTRKHVKATEVQFPLYEPDEADQNLPVDTGRLLETANKELSTAKPVADRLQQLSMKFDKIGPKLNKAVKDVSTMNQKLRARQQSIVRANASSVAKNNPKDLIRAMSKK